MMQNIHHLRANSLSSVLGFNIKSAIGIAYAFCYATSNIFFLFGRQNNTLNILRKKYPILETRNIQFVLINNATCFFYRLWMLIGRISDAIDNHSLFFSTNCFPSSFLFGFIGFGFVFRQINVPTAWIVTFADNWFKSLLALGATHPGSHTLPSFCYRGFRLVSPLMFKTYTINPFVRLFAPNPIFAHILSIILSIIAILIRL